MKNFEESLKLFYCLAFLYGHSSDAFAAVHRRAASKSHHSLTAAFSEKFQALVYISVSRIGLNAIVNYIFNSGCIHGIKHALRQPQIHEDFICYNQYLVLSFFPDKFGQLFYRTGTFKSFRHSPRNQVHADFKYSLINSAIHLSHCFSSFRSVLRQ